jgi:3-methyladenine DNA glycosylase/8-oxoguanine DNA glycosylase
MGALVLQVIGQQLSLAAAATILARLEALHGGRLPTPAEILATDAQTLRQIGLSRAKGVYLHDLAARSLTQPPASREMREKSASTCLPAQSG